MNLAIIALNSAAKMSDIVRQTADNVNISVFNGIQAFIESTSMRTQEIDRIFLLQDAYTACGPSAKGQLELLSQHLGTHFVETRVIALAKDPAVLQEFSEFFSSATYITVSMKKVSAKFVSTITLASIDDIKNTFPDYITTSTLSDISSTYAPAQPPQAQTQEPTKKGGLFGGFGSKKQETNTNSSFAANLAASPLTQGQSGGFGSAAQPPSGSNPFGAPAQANPFGAPAQPQANPFGAPAQANPFENNNSQPQANPFETNTGNTQANPFGNQPQANPFGNAEPAQANPFGGTAEPAQANPFGNAGVAEQPQSNPFGNQPQANPFEAPTAPMQSNPFGNAEPAQSNPFDAGQSQANPFESKPEATQSNPFATNTGTTNPFEASSQPEPVGNTFDNQPQANPFATGAEAPQANPFENNVSAPTQANPFATGAEASQSNPFTDNTQAPQSNPFETSNQGNTNPFMEAPTPQNVPVSADVAPSNPFTNPTTPVQPSESPVQPFSEQGSVNSFPTAESPQNANFGAFDEVEEYTPDFADTSYSPPTTQFDAPQANNLDMSRLQKANTASNYNFNTNVAPMAQPTQPTMPNVEEVAPTAMPAMGAAMLDDSAYRQQFEPAPKIIERVVEKQVFVGGGGADTPTQTLLDNGKQVVLIITGDRRSGITYTALSLAQLYARRYSTLLVDLDTDTCGGQLYQDIELLNNEEENVKSGILRAKSVTLLSNLVHRTEEGFDYLFSMIGNDQPTINDLNALAGVLNTQNRFQFTIIDCPWTKLQYLDILAPKAKVMICVDANITGCHNTVELLNSLPPNSSFISAIERAGGYIAKWGTGATNLRDNMAWVGDMFESEERNWAELRIVGDSDKAQLPNVMTII